jgi:hypothetical protein
MKKSMQILSYLSLVVLVAAPILFYAGRVSLDVNKIILNTATAIWFLSALCWMGRGKADAQ